MSQRARPAAPEELPAVAELWHDAWHDAHAAIVPAGLIAERGTGQFLERLKGFGDRLRVIGPAGAPLGMCVIADNQVDQMFVGRRARGGGIASVLLADAEERLRGEGCARAHLDCAIGNARAVRFYQKHGWVLVRDEDAQLVAGEKGFVLRCHVFEKDLV